MVEIIVHRNTLLFATVALLVVAAAVATIVFAPAFFQTYFIDPLVQGTGYNVVNTAVFAAILIAAVLGVYALLRRMRIRVDRAFFVGIVPFIVLGGALRALEDFNEATGAARNFFLVTPLIYVTMFVVALASLLAAIAIARVTKNTLPYHRAWAAIGIAALLLTLAQLRFANPFAFGMVVIVSLIWAALLVGVKFFARGKVASFLTPENSFIIFVHLFDATTTFVAVSYLGYFEQHVLPSFLIAIIGPAAIFLLKIVVVPAVLYLFDRELAAPKDMEKNRFLKIVVLILGLGPGVRNFVRMVAGV